MKPNANQTIDILKKLKAECGTGPLAYWIAPNVILTLSGVRAYCDGVFWENPEDKDMLDTWHKEIAQSLGVLKTIAGIGQSETEVKEVRGEKYASFDVVTQSGLDYVMQHTALLDAGLATKLKQASSVQELFDPITKNIKGRDSYSTEDLNYIAFGILLGYPDKSITTSVKAWEDPDPFAEPLVDADIRGAGYYACPQPVYSYPRHLVTDADIQAHEKLWSNILKDFYVSDFHKELAKDEAFQQKMQEIGSLR